jgi:predicted secreted protein|tara:strand:- start:219 stop:512 length:294 start_codon:yes stop_codon:yes gene_type:complete
MGITSAIVLFAVIWFLTLFIVLPLRLQTQGDVGKIEPGTHAGSPVNPQMKKRFLVTTAVAVVLWAIIAGSIISGVFAVRDFDWFNRMATPEVSQTGG